MAEAKFDGKNLYSRQGARVGAIDGRYVYNARGSRLARIDGSIISNAAGVQVGRVTGGNFYDGHGRKVASLHDIKQHINDHGSSDATLAALWHFFR